MKKKEQPFEAFINDAASKCSPRTAEDISHPLNHSVSIPLVRQSEQLTTRTRVDDILEQSRRVDARVSCRGPPRPVYHPPAIPINPLPVGIQQHLVSVIRTTVNQSDFGHWGDFGQISNNSNVHQQ